MIHTDFRRFEMTEETNLQLRAHALTQTTNMFLTHRIWCEWEKYPGIRACVIVVCHNKFYPTMSWSWFLSLLEFNNILYTDFVRMGMTQETNLKLEASTQALTQTILQVA